MGFPARSKVILILSIAIPLANGELIDMTFPFEKNMITWPNIKPFNSTLFHKGPFQRAPFMIVYDIALSEHVGTHMDAPVHFAEGKLSVDEIPPENLIGEAIVVNITEKVLKDRDYIVAVDDLKDWEKKYGRIPDGSIVFILTGLGKYWGDFKKYMGTNSTNSSEFHFPGFGTVTAQWLVDNRNIKGVGLDSRSVDIGQSNAYAAHRIFMKNNIFGLESVANIDKLPPKGAIVHVMPMKIKDGSGGPTRIIAQTDPAGRSTKSHEASIVVLLMCAMSMVIFG